MGFIGEYNHTVDAKGRVIVPSRFREILGEEFIVTKGLDHCLCAYENSAWQAFEQKLADLPTNTRENRQLTRFFLSGATSCEVDKQGRILLPAVLRTFAQIEKDAVLVGNGNRVEIWSKDRWDAANNYDDIEDIAESLEGFSI